LKLEKKELEGVAMGSGGNPSFIHKGEEKYVEKGEIEEA